MTALGVCFGLLGYGLLMMLAGPGVLTRQRWTVSHPTLALAVWLGALVSGVAAVLSAFVVAVVGSLAISCRAGVGECREVGDLSAATIFVVGWLLTALVGGLVCTVAVRSFHLLRDTSSIRATFDRLVEAVATERTVGSHTVLVCASDAALVMSYPRGRNSRILVSESVADAMPSDQLEALVEHERAHLRWRHGSLMQLAHLHVTCTRLPSARAFESAVATMIELSADDAAARHCGTPATAAALRSLADLQSEEALRLRAQRLSSRARQLSPV